MLDMEMVRDHVKVHGRYPNTLISISGLLQQQVEHIINQAAWVRHLDEVKYDCLKVCHEDTQLGSAFCEPSTRTRLTTELAATKLGMRVVGIAGAEGSSVMKGETGPDTCMFFRSAHCNIIAMRHPDKDAIWQAAYRYPNVKFINCGNGAEEHPTQALLDLLMWMYVFGGFEHPGEPFQLGKFDVLRGRIIAVCGDLLYGRTFGSGKYIYDMFGIKVIGVCPPALQPESVPDTLKYTQTVSLEEALDMGAEGLMMTRIQRERFQSEEEYQKYAGIYRVTPELLKRFPKLIKVLHPLPRYGKEPDKCEIDPRVDELVQAGYEEQMTCGIYARESIMLDMLGYQFV